MIIMTAQAPAGRVSLAPGTDVHLMADDAWCH